MGKITIGLPGNVYKQRRKQKTIDGNKIVVKSTSYYGELNGWELIINNEFKRFNNGIRFKNRMDITEALEWGINTYKGLK